MSKVYVVRQYEDIYGVYNNRTAAERRADEVKLAADLPDWWIYEFVVNEDTQP
jgi:hypothetical protein